MVKIRFFQKLKFHLHGILINRDVCQPQQGSNMKKWVVLFILILTLLSGLCIVLADGAYSVANNKPVKAGVNDLNLIKAGSTNASVVHQDVQKADSREEIDDTDILELNPDINPIPTPGVDLKILNVKMSRHKNPENGDGKHDIYMVDFLVRNLGWGKSGETNIAFSNGQICTGGPAQSQPVVPQLKVPALNPYEWKHITLTKTASPGCKESIIGIVINPPEIGCFGKPIDECVPTMEAIYSNNNWSKNYAIPDITIPYT